VAVHELLDRAAARHPGKVALRSRYGDVDYAGLKAATLAASAHLSGLGIAAGDRVATVLDNSLAVVCAIYAASRLGAAAVVCDPLAKAYGLQRTLADAEPAVVLTTTDRVDVDAAAPTGSTIVRVDGEGAPGALAGAGGVDAGAGEAGFVTCGCDAAPAVLVYTSGTTSSPRGVVVTHANIAFTTAAIQRCLGLVTDDVIGVFVPLSFDYGLYQLFLAANVGATVALGTPGMVGPGLLSWIDRWGVTVLPALPTMASILTRLGRRDSAKLAGVRCITNTGSHLPPALADELVAICPGAEVFAMYGLTECKRVSILLPAERADRPSSVGRPLPETSVALVEGELVVDGRHVTAGYWRSPRETARRFRPAAGGERRLFTGDRCEIDDAGYLTFCGRLDDIYKHSGYRVSVAEVEAAATDIPGVRLAAVLPPDAERGPVLFV
jgi:acyl-CoA synthetase (AMP-forming)/AMP-acid ligase II